MKYQFLMDRYLKYSFKYSLICKICSYFLKYSRSPINILDRSGIFSKNSAILHLIIFKHHFSLFRKNIPDILLYALMLLCFYPKSNHYIHLFTRGRSTLAPPVAPMTLLACRVRARLTRNSYIMHIGTRTQGLSYHWGLGASPPIDLTSPAKLLEISTVFPL